MKKFIVTFTRSIRIDAKDEDHARDLAEYELELGEVIQDIEEY
jgi:hypothetical protein